MRKMKYIPRINCGYSAGEEPLCWDGEPFDTEEECQEWIDEIMDLGLFADCEISGGIYPHPVE